MAGTPVSNNWSKKRGNGFGLQRSSARFFRKFFLAGDSSPSPVTKLRVDLLPTAKGLVVLMLFPMAIYIPQDGAIFRGIFSFWTAVLRCNAILWAFIVGLAVAGALALDLVERTPKKTEKTDLRDVTTRRKLPWRHPIMLSIVLAVIVAVFNLINSLLNMHSPGWIWMPFLWFGQYRVYLPNELEPALQGNCIGEPVSNNMAPLCLPQASWNTLSAGRLSSKDPADVKAVLKGVQYAKKESGGLVIAVLARDTVNAVEPLRRNVESLVPFFSNDKVTVVIFENDSVDGTRDAFKKWEQEATRYHVNLMSCGEENPDCKLSIAARYGHEKDDTLSVAGKLAKFRQDMLDFILKDPKLNDYSHLVVLDLDLAVSISPLGVMHSLGSKPNLPVASSGRQVIQGSLGTLTVPYDMVAAKFHPTPANRRALSIHQAFCHLAPPGDKWRFECVNVSVIFLMLVIDAYYTRAKEPYLMDSAYNGAALYPLNLLRESGAKYDLGDDGQQCEHVSLHYAMKGIYVNPKWSFNLSPENPSGPTGEQSENWIGNVLFRPVSLIVYVQGLVLTYLFVWSIVTLTLYLLYPLAVSGRTAMSRRGLLPTYSAKRRRQRLLLLQQMMQTKTRR